MARVTGITSARALEISSGIISSASVSGSDLLLGDSEGETIVTLPNVVDDLVPQVPALVIVGAYDVAAESVVVPDWSSPSHSNESMNDLLEPLTSAIAVDVSSDGRYLAVAQPDPGSVRIYKRSGDSFTHIVDLLELDGLSQSLRWSPDSKYLAVGRDGATTLSVFKRTGDNFEELPPPAVFPSGAARGITWAPDGMHLAVGHIDQPYLTIYKRSADSFIKLGDPDPPNGPVVSVSWSANGRHLAIGGSSAPYVEVYKRAGIDPDPVFTKLTPPSPAITDAASAVEWSPDASYLAVSHFGTPYVTIYKRVGDVLTKIANPDSVPSGAFDPTGYGASVSWSPDGRYLALGHYGFPQLTTYRRDGDFFTTIPHPMQPPLEAVISSAWHPAGDFMVVVYYTYPYLTIYKSAMGQVAGVPVISP